MKKFLILGLVLAIASYAAAATVSLVVDQEDAKTSYEESDIITINLIGSGFTAGMPDGFCSLTINAIMGPGIASGQTVSDAYLPQMQQDGTAVNNGTTLISGPITGTAAMGDYVGVPNGQAAYTFEYHVPDVPDSTIITLYIDGITVGGSFGAPVTLTAVNPLELHVMPEPMTIALLGLGGLFLRRRK